MIELLISGFPLWQWLFMMGIAAVAGLTHGFVGIGFPLLATPLFGLMFGFRNAVAMLVLPTLVITVCIVLAYRGQADLRTQLRRFWPLPLLMPVGVALGVSALHTLDARVLMLIMVAVIGLFLVMDRLGRTELPWARAHATLLAVPFALAAGFTEAAINVAGPLLLIYFLLLDLPVVVIIATLNWLFLLGKTGQALLMAARGAFGPPALAVLVPVALVGSLAFLAGLRLRRRVDPSHYRVWLKRMLGVSAVGLLGKVVSGAE